MARDNTSQDIVRETPKNRRVLELRAAYLKTLIAGAQAHRNVLLQRTRAQVQTVSTLFRQESPMQSLIQFAGVELDWSA
jgi:hypothetical protein